MKYWRFYMLWLNFAMILLLVNCSAPLFFPEIETDLSEENSLIADSLILIRGVMEKNGKRLKSVDSIKFKLNNNKIERPFPDNEIGIFNLEIIYDNAQKQGVPFNAMIISDKDSINHGYFELYVPIYGKIKEMYIKTSVNSLILYQFNLKNFY